MNYEEMSDFEINKRVAKAQYFLTHWSTSKHVKVSMQSCEEPCGSRVYDPCNSPSDAWPIIVDSKIGGHYGRASPNWYFAVSRCEKWIATDKNPLRAFMICYLMMQEGK